MKATLAKSTSASPTLPHDLFQRTVTVADVVRMYVSEWEIHLNSRLKTAQDSLKDVTAAVKQHKDAIIERVRNQLKSSYCSYQGTRPIYINATVKDVEVDFDDKTYFYTVTFEIKSDGLSTTASLSNRYCSSEDRKRTVRCADDLWDELTHLQAQQAKLLDEVSKCKTELATISSKERQVSAELTKRTLMEAGVTPERLCNNEIRTLLGLPVSAE